MIIWREQISRLHTYIMGVARSCSILYDTHPNEDEEEEEEEKSIMNSFAFFSYVKKKTFH